MSNLHKIMSVFGTRPEAIKMAPVILELKKRGIEQCVCVTGQQREMLRQMLNLFEIEPDYDLDIMSAGQSLEHITTESLNGLKSIIEETKPGLIMVQGDTTTAFVGALAAFYHKVPVAHIEAGLRTDDIYNPYPEEMNRRLISQISSINFAPTQLAQQNLEKSDVPGKTLVTGNTVIDALLWTVDRKKPFINPLLREMDFSNKRTILVTTHRRENLGDGMDGIFKAIARLAKQHSDVSFIFPVHLNPKIQKHADELLGDISNIHLTEPLEYSDLAALINMSYFVMTDSGGIQEEAPALGKPVLVLRTTTERPEGLDAGTAKLVGTQEESVYAAATELLTNESVYEKMAKAVSPYGDGTAAKRIVDYLEQP